MVKEIWSGLPANRKRLLIVLAAALPGLFLIYLLVSGEERPLRSANTEDGVETNILTGTSAKRMGIDALANKQRQQEKTSRELAAEISNLQSQSEVLSKQSNDKIERLAEKLDELMRMQQGKNAGSRERSRYEGVTFNTRDSTPKIDVVLDTEEDRVIPKKQQGGDSVPESRDMRSPGDEFSGTSWDIFRDPEQAGPPPPEPTRTILGGEEEKPAKIRIYTAEAAEEDNDDEQKVYIPPGTMLTGVLINGMDAPTSASGSRDPHPALVRIKHEAILPNHFSVDVRDCFVVVSGHGELSSERAFLRAATLSCVRNDGGVIETKLEAYGVGEDSKAGLRGKVVSKQGKLLRNALIAGFAEGLSDIFRPTAISGLQTDPDDRLQFQTPGFTNTAKAAGFSGASSAMERLADYYIDLAEELFPVIEIDGGRRIDLIMVKGATLKLMGGLG